MVISMYTKKKLKINIPLMIKILKIGIEGICPNTITAIYGKAHN